jgi:hypothetical protein
MQIKKLLKLQETLEDSNNRKIPNDLRLVNQLVYYSESGRKFVKCSEMQLNHLLRIAIKKGIFTNK